jgi:electron transfer flavoprotein alpha subunit
MQLLIHQEKLTTELKHKLLHLSPFKAIELKNDNTLEINAGCKLCKLCVKQSEGAITLEEDNITVDKKL